MPHKAENDDLFGMDAGPYADRNDLSTFSVAHLGAVYAVADRLSFTAATDALGQRGARRDSAQ
jgi:hypothetical protein